MAFAQNLAQKRELVWLGVIPMNDNERVRPKHAELRARVEHFPINGPKELCTVAAMAPFCAAAMEQREAILALGGDEEADYASDETGSNVSEDSDVGDGGEEQERGDGEAGSPRPVRRRTVPVRYM